MKKKKSFFWGLMVLILLGQLFSCSLPEKTVVMKTVEQSASGSNSVEITDSFKTVSPLWTKFHPDTKEGKDIFATSSHVYLVSTFYKNNREQCNLAQYHWSGTLVKQVSFGDSQERDIPQAVTVDAEGNVYVAGTTEGSLGGNQSRGVKDVFIRKYDQNLNYQWTQFIGSGQSGAEYSENAVGIYVNADGDVFVVGKTASHYLANMSTDTNGTVFIAKYRSNGFRVWTKLYGGQVDSNRKLDITCAGMDKGGAIHLPISLKYAYNNSDNYMLLRINSDGNLTAGWTIVNNQPISFKGMTIDANYNIYLAGILTTKNSDGSIYGNDGYVMKINRSYQVVWGKNYHKKNFRYYQFSSIANDSAGNLYVTERQAAYPIVTKGTEIYYKDILKLNANGALLENHTINSTPGPEQGYQESMNKIIVNPTNRIYITGQSCSPYLNGVSNPQGKSGNAYLIKYSL